MGLRYSEVDNAFPLPHCVSNGEKERRPGRKMELMGMGPVQAISESSARYRVLMKGWEKSNEENI
jgi:hypothetical protein